MLERYHGDLPLIDGAVEAVRALAASYPLAVASSSNRPLIDAVLETAGIADCFAATVSSEEVPRGKPSPDVYLEAARRLGVAPRAVRGGRGLGERDPRGEGGRDVRDRVSEPALPARCGGARAGGCGDRGARRAGGGGAVQPGRQAEAGRHLAPRATPS